MELHVFLSYHAFWTAVALTPGPAVIYSMSRATRHGLKSAFAGICGIQAGNFILFASVALGLAALLETASGAFTALRIGGALYLLVLGIRMLAATFRSPLDIPAPAVTTRESKSLFHGLLVQVTNPKALLFVSAVLPNFIDRHKSVPLQLTILVLTTVAIDTLVLFTYALLAQRGAQSFQKSHFKAWAERLYGTALLFFGSKLLIFKD